MTKLEFHVGNYKFHDVPIINFQLNRFHAIGGDFEELKEIAAKVTDLSSFCELMGKAAKKAKAEGRLKQAVAYLRGEEFFLPSGNPRREEVYDEYKKLYYQVNADLMKENNVQRAEVPYEKGFLPVLYCVNPNPKGIVVIHGGFDSYVEEHLKFMIYMYQNGYSAYIFEGPGQGEVIYRHGIPFTPEWHRPVGAVLDYFHLDNVALAGISLGAVLCKLAAAKEPRIKYLCSIGIMTDAFDTQFSQSPKEYKDKVIELLDQGRADEFNEMIYALMKKNAYFEWSTIQGLFVNGAKTPYEMYSGIRKYTVKGIAGQITQDYLCIAGQNDHGVPVWLSHDEIDLMRNVRSFTLRIITAAEKGDDHCNVSNRKLMLDTLINWLGETGKHIAELEGQCPDA